MIGGGRPKPYSRSSPRHGATSGGPTDSPADGKRSGRNTTRGRDTAGLYDSRGGDGGAASTVSLTPSRVSFPLGGGQVGHEGRPNMHGAEGSGLHGTDVNHVADVDAEVTLPVVSIIPMRAHNMDVVNISAPSTYPKVSFNFGGGSVGHGAQTNLHGTEGAPLHGAYVSHVADVATTATLTVAPNDTIMAHNLSEGNALSEVGSIENTVAFSQPSHQPAALP